MADTMRSQGLRNSFKNVPPARKVDAGKASSVQAKVPKDKGRPKRKKKITFNSPKTTKVTYG